MYRFGKRSKKKLASAEDDLVKLCNEVIKNFDFGVIESSRTEARQIQMFKNGRSQLNGITRKSKHQVTKQNPKSKAIDCFPYEKGHNTFDGSMKSELMFFQMYWHFMRASFKLKIKIRWGGLWSFRDYPHLELV